MRKESTMRWWYGNLLHNEYVSTMQPTTRCSDLPATIAAQSNRRSVFAIVVLIRREATTAKTTTTGNTQNGTIKYSHHIMIVVIIVARVIVYDVWYVFE